MPLGVSPRERAASKKLSTPIIGDPAATLRLESIAPYRPPWRLRREERHFAYLEKVYYYSSQSQKGSRYIDKATITIPSIPFDTPSLNRSIYMIDRAPANRPVSALRYGLKLIYDIADVKYVIYNCHRRAISKINTHATEIPISR